MLSQSSIHGRMLAVTLCQWEVLTAQQECRGGGEGGEGAYLELHGQETIGAHV